MQIYLYKISIQNLISLMELKYQKYAVHITKNSFSFLHIQTTG